MSSLPKISKKKAARMRKGATPFSQIPPKSWNGKKHVRQRKVQNAFDSSSSDSSNSDSDSSASGSDSSSSGYTSGSSRSSYTSNGDGESVSTAGVGTYVPLTLKSVAEAASSKNGSVSSDDEDDDSNDDDDDDDDEESSSDESYISSASSISSAASTVSSLASKLSSVKLPKIKTKSESTRPQTILESPINSASDSDSDSEGEEPQYTYVERWERWWLKKKSERLHPSLIHFQTIEKKRVLNRELDILEKLKENKKKRRKELKKSIIRIKNEEFTNMVQSRDRLRRDEDEAKRGKNQKGGMERMRLLDRWGYENDARKVKEEQDRISNVDKKRVNDLNEKRMKDKKDEDEKEEIERLEGLKETQEILSYMRRAGTIKGVNPKKPPEEDPQRETAESVLLIVRPQTPEADEPIVYKPLDTKTSVRMMDDNNNSAMTRPNSAFDAKGMTNTTSLPPAQVSLPPAKEAYVHKVAAATTSRKDERMSDTEVAKIAAQQLMDAIEEGKLEEDKLSPHPKKKRPKKEKKNKSKSNIQYFTVDLKRFRNAIHLKGDCIGTVGGRAFSRELISGACTKLSSIDLSWNLMKYAGVSMLFDAFSRGVLPNLQRMDLRGNHIDFRCIECLRGAYVGKQKSAAAALVAAAAMGEGGNGEGAEAGGLKKLKFLDLRFNSIGDKGAKIFAHLSMLGILKNIEVLRIDSNQIGSAGQRALFMAMGSNNSIGKLMPKLKILGMKNNGGGAKAIEGFGIIPPWIMV